MDDVLNRVVLSGEAKGEALGRFGGQMDKWELVMPDVEPLVLHFGLGDFEKTGLIEYWIANEMEVGQKHSFAGVGPALLLELSKPCMVDDNYFEDRAIPLGGNYE